MGKIGFRIRASRNWKGAPDFYLSPQNGIYLVSIKCETVDVAQKIINIKEAIFIDHSTYTDLYYKWI